MFTRINQGEQGIGPTDAGDVVAGGVSAAVAKLAPANVGAWRVPGALDGERTYPFGTVPAGVGLVINLGEVAVHGWDLAQASGQKAEIDPEAAEIMWGLYSQSPMDQYREFGVFGPEVKVPGSAPIGDRLLGLLGRQP
jgi:uncharacterized protein (TIGR03086 family)